MSNILVVDDIPEICDLITHFLEPEGHSVTTAINGSQAIRLIRQQPFDLIITDVLMPEEDGFQLIKKIRADGIQTPIICVSAGDRNDSSYAYLRCAETLGANCTVSKPLDSRKFLAAVKTCLDGNPPPAT